MGKNGNGNGNGKKQETARVGTNKPEEKADLNTLKRVGTAAHIYANFDQKEGGQNVDKKEDRRKKRILRPGAIILPNLDIDDASSPRTRFTVNQVDARVDDKVNDGNDPKDITLFKVAEPKPVVGNVTKVTMRVHKADAKRVRIWGIPHDKSKKEIDALLGSSAKPKADEIKDYATVVIDKNTGTANGDFIEHKLLDQKKSGKTQLPPADWEIDFYAESLTLAGDPATNEPAPDGAAPEPPGEHRPPEPDTDGGSQESPDVNNKDTSKTIYAKDQRYWKSGKPMGRAPGDVWIELIQEIKNKPSAAHKDIGLFTIAPWLMTWNSLECERVYVAYCMEGTSFPGTAFDNHGMVWDLQHACKAAGLVNKAPKAPDNDSTKPIKTNERKEIDPPAKDVKFYVIDGATVKAGPWADRWVQDEFEIGYCYAPHRYLNLAVHVPRNRGLQRFVEEDLPQSGLAVYNGIAMPGRGVDYGGNLEVSPPVDKATGVLAKSDAGPKINHTRKAPFGKIILGDCQPRPCHDELREFLMAQMVQPILAVNTSWLGVGHVDEFMSFVRASKSLPSPASQKKFRMMFASVRLMKIVLQEVWKVDGGASMHRGKYNEHQTYDEHFVSDWLWGLDHTLSYSEQIDAKYLAPIRKRVHAGLGLDERDILSVPTFFLPPSPRVLSKTVAHNVGMVNMLVVNDHLMIPSPHGPRLAKDKAKKALEAILKRWFANYPPIPTAVLPSENEHYFWARPGESLEQIAMYFAPHKAGDPFTAKELRTSLMNKIRNPGAAYHSNAAKNSAMETRVKDFMKAIRDEPANKNAPTPINTVAPTSDNKFTKWMRIKIPDKTVDVIEGFMKSILERLGNKVHFIENFESYHAQWGEVHCGTNAKRKPPEGDSVYGVGDKRWWQDDLNLYDPDYDTSYTP